MPGCRYLQGLFALAEEGSKDVRRVVCVGLVQMLHLQPSCLMPHMSSLITYMLQATQVRPSLCNQTLTLLSRPLVLSVICQDSGTVKSQAPLSLVSASVVTNAGMDSTACHTDIGRPWALLLWHGRAVLSKRAVLKSPGVPSRLETLTWHSAPCKLLLRRSQLLLHLRGRPCRRSNLTFGHDLWQLYISRTS